MNKNMSPIDGTGRFNFSCDPDVPCFNACCRDLNQFLTPYDILRLKKHLNITSTEFLAHYCSQHTGPRSGLPIISLKPADPVELTCLFWREKGCAVYENRPSSCRIYPLVRAISRSRETGEITEQYMVLKEPHCKGFDRKTPISVNDWIERQGLSEYNAYNDMLMEIISMKNQYIPGPLNLATGRLFALACYDLDAFRTNVFERNIFDNIDMDAGILEMARQDDEALLRVGMTAVRQALLDPGR